MTIPAGDTTIDTHIGNGTADTFDYNFKITDKADLKVTKTEDATGVDTELAVDADYTVTGVGDANGGNVTLVAGNLPTGYTLTIEDNVILSQLAQFGNQSAFFGLSHENAMDKLTRLCKRLFSASTLHLSLPSSAFGANLQLPSGTARAGKYMAFDANGDFSVAQSLGVWRGDWVTGTDYVAQDFMRDPANGNLYIAPTAYTAGATVAADVAGGSLVLILDMVAAQAQAGYAQEWANKAKDALVSAAAGGDEVDDYSALHFSEKAKDHGLEWATRAEDSLIPTANGGNGTTHYSALHHAAKAAAETTYAKEWATKAEDSLVSTDAGGDGSTEYSAKHWATKANADRVVVASDKAIVAADKATVAADKAIVAADKAAVAADLAATNQDTIDTAADVVAAAASAAAAAASAASVNITSGTAAPSGGNDGDIYIQYTA